MCRARGKRSLPVLDTRKQNIYEKELVYYWSDELQLAVRRNAGDKNAEAEPSCPIVAPATGAEALAPYVATWPDGDRKEIAEKTNAAIREMLQGAPGAKSSYSTHLWSGIHEASNNQVYVRQKPDNRLLMSTFEQTKWIAGVAVQEFAEPGEKLPSLSGGIETLPNEHPAVQASFAFFLPFVEDYCKGVHKSRQAFVQAKNDAFQPIKNAKKEADKQFKKQQQEQQKLQQGAADAKGSMEKEGEKDGEKDGEKAQKKQSKNKEGEKEGEKVASSTEKAKKTLVQTHVQAQAKAQVQGPQKIRLPAFAGETFM